MTAGEERAYLKAVRRCLIASIASSFLGDLIEGWPRGAKLAVVALAVLVALIFVFGPVSTRHRDG